MSTFYHTDTAADGLEITAATITGPDGALDSAIKSEETNRAAGDAVLSGAANVLKGRVDTVIGVTTGILANAITGPEIAAGAVSTSKIPNNAITTALIADNNVTTAKIPDGAITTAKLADNGVLTGKIAASAVGSVQIADNAVITQKISDSGITTPKIADSNVTTPKIADGNVTGPKINAAALDVPNIMWAPDNVGPAPYQHYNGKNRWWAGSGVPEASLALVFNDLSSPYSTPILRLFNGSASTSAGKVMWMSETPLVGGSTSIMTTFEWKAASGTYQFKVGCYDGSNVLLGSVSSPVRTGDSAAHYEVLPVLAVPAGTVYIRTWMQRVSGTVDLDVYHIWVNKGTYAAISPPPSAPSLSGYSGVNGIVPDPTFVEIDPGIDWGGRLRWGHPELMSVIRNNPNNPWGGNSVKCTTAGATGQPGKRIYCSEENLQPGVTTVAFAAIVTADAPNVRIRAAFQDASNSLITTLDGAYFTSTGTAQLIYTDFMTVPATTNSIALFVELGYSGTPRNTELHALWGGTDGVLDAWPMPREIPSFQRDAILALSAIGSELLADWRAFVARREGGASIYANLLLSGDSWIEHGDLTNALRANLQGIYGNAGGGYVDFCNVFEHSFYSTDLLTSSTRNGTATGTNANTTTWTDTMRDSGNGRGAALTDVRAVDATATMTLVTSVPCTIIRIYAHRRSGGGMVGYRIDGGTWKQFDTDFATPGTLTVTESGLSNGTHTIDFRIDVFGSAGVTLLGIDLRNTNAGVVIHKIGVSGSDALNYAAVDATVWQSAYAAIAAGASANVGGILLGTNDRSRTAFPNNFRNSLQTLADRIRAAVPLSDLLFIAPADAALGGALPMPGYRAAIRGAASQNIGAAFFDGGAVLGPNSQSTARSLWVDTAHPNADGMRVIAGGLTRMLRVWS
jgi:lysophospholipase L1-like esterase